MQLIKDIYHTLRYWVRKAKIKPQRIKKAKVKYVIWRESSSCGLFSFLFTTIGQIAYADYYGMIPVVDFMNYENTYLEESLQGKENVWEYYFRQPYEGMVDEKTVKSVSQIKMCNGGSMWNPSANYRLFYNKRGELDYYRKICQTYIKLSDEAEKKLILVQQQLFAEKNNILGVLARGTDYVTLKPKGHAIQPDVDTQLIPKIDEMILKDGYEYVYLATEDQIILEKFKNKYSEKLLFYNREHIPYNHSEFKNIATYTSQMNSSKKQQGMDYLMQIMLLTQCQGFVGGITSASICATCLPNTWENTYVFDLGTY